MVSNKNGFIGKCMENTIFLMLTHYHCIIHQEAICAKVLSLEYVVKITNSILAATIQHRLFQQLLQDEDAKYADLISHTEVRWLSRDKILLRFVCLINEIK